MWLLKYEYRIRKTAINIKENYLPGLSFNTFLMVDMFGIADKNFIVKSSIEPLRRIISRDPVLKNIITPEIIYSVINKYNIDPDTDKELCYVVLASMGFTSNVLNQIIEWFVSQNDFVMPSSAMGEFSDDSSNLSAIRQYEIDLPMEVQRNFRNDMVNI